VAALAVVLFAAPAAQAAAQPAFAPGEETRVNDASVGPSGHYLVYVPPEYTPDRAWPILFTYHGQGGKPTTEPLRGFLDGKGFLIVGMDYWWDSMDKSAKIDRDIDIVKHVASQVSARLKVNAQQAIIGGTSAGGWASSGIAEAAPTLWAGLVILGSGRYGDIRGQRPLPTFTGSPFLGRGIRKPSGPSFTGKGVYVGDGRSDINYDWAKKAADYYRAQEADVTFETYDGGHGTYPKSKQLIDFLWNTGPLKQAKADIAEARAAESGGRLGQALAKYLKAAEGSGGNDLGAEAAKAAEKIARQADLQLSEAEADAAAQRIAEAIVHYTQVINKYDGTQYAERARQAVAALKAGAAAPK